MIDKLIITVITLEIMNTMECHQLTKLVMRFVNEDKKHLIPTDIERSFDFLEIVREVLEFKQSHAASVEF